MQLEITMVLLLVAGLARGLPTIVNTTLCVGAHDGTQHCGSCLQPIECKTQEPVALPISCYPGTVCEEITPTTVACVPIASATACQCTSDKCDDYDSQFRVKCDASGITDVVDCNSRNRCIGNGTCSACPSSGSVDSFVDQECSSRYRCTNGAFSSVVNCAQGEYVSKNGSCSQAPPIPCAAADLCTAGLCPDLTNCSRYYICDPNQVPPAIEYFSCPSDQYFNPKTYLCESTTTNCDPWTTCKFTSVDGGTKRTSTATVSPDTPPEDCNANTVGNFPHGPCDSQYWACRQGSGSSYEVVEMQCPNGLVHSTNPDYPYCIDPSEEATCHAYAAEH
ncbi:peritrophin-48 [Hyalella azteca]|uniref:Peritrophin-48 n=1 Tax=Hyalella azteca TaxID=294128 RepID=A0A8B7NC08_HYAAZ|nr:peritrophin-48 [Hyalella azteca]